MGPGSATDGLRGIDQRLKRDQRKRGSTRGGERQGELGREQGERERKSPRGKQNVTDPIGSFLVTWRFCVSRDRYLLYEIFLLITFEFGLSLQTHESTEL